ncbi:MAG: hypothetical protein FWD52_03040 [Candidatus Bathyarchaeota archaeon]|nr:hypothetical protein [Candidatus Termiticorpusculum sp.]
MLMLVGWQCQLVEAVSITIEHTETLNQWGNASTSVYRGRPASVSINLNSVFDANVRIHVTLIDVNNVPVAVVSTDAVISGQKTITVDLFVASCAFVGIGYYRVIITDPESRPLTALTIPICIELMGDFDLDNKVFFPDLVIFTSAFSHFNQNKEIPDQYTRCDLNGDKKIDFIDLVLFTANYIEDSN